MNRKEFILFLNENNLIKSKSKKVVREGIESTQQYYTFTEPDIIDTIKKTIESVEKNTKLLKINYSDGTPNFEVILKINLEEKYSRDYILGKTLIIGKLNEIKEKLIEKLDKELNLLTVNVLGYKYDNNKHELICGMNIIGSFTKVIK